MDRQYFDQRFKSLEQEFSNWLPQFKEISKYILPLRGFFDGDTPNSGRRPDYQALINGKPGLAASRMAAGMCSGLTSPSRPWFKLETPDPELMKFGPVREWLDDVEKRMLSVFSRSNIYGELNAHYEELGGFGTGATAVVDDYRDVIRARTYTMGEYYVSVGPDGRVNGIARKYSMTVAQVVKEFGIKNVSENVRADHVNKHFDKWVKVCHLVEENDNRIPGMQDFRNMPFRSVYWEQSSDQKKFLRRSGFEEFPVMVSRWVLTTCLDSYGKGPGWISLGDVRQLQKMETNKLIGIDKLIDPPMTGDSNIGVINTLPGGITRTSQATPNGGVRPAYQINPALAELERLIFKKEQDIESAFYNDLFLAITTLDHTNRTAHEIAARNDEKFLVLGPVIERIEGDLLDPTITRTFSIMNRRGLIPPAPKELQGMDLEVKYISILAQAQRMAGTSAIERFTGWIGATSRVLPRVAMAVDEIEMVAQYGSGLGIAPRIIRSPETVAKMEAAMAQAQAEAQAAQNAAMEVQAAKTLADTKVGGNSALDALIGTTGAAGGAA